MLAKVMSCAVIGLEGAIIQVEVDISPGLPSFTYVDIPMFAQWHQLYLKKRYH